MNDELRALRALAMAYRRYDEAAQSAADAPADDIEVWREMDDSLDAMDAAYFAWRSVYLKAPKLLALTRSLAR